MKTSTLTMKAGSLMLAFFVAIATACGQVRPEQITLTKQLSYDQHTLADEYPYGKTTRRFQWDKIKVQLADIENAERKGGSWGVLENRRDEHGRAPLVYNSHTDEYHRAADSLGNEQYQGIPLYDVRDSVKPVLYGDDGMWVRVVSQDERWTTLETIHEITRDTYRVPTRYVHTITNPVPFTRVIVADRAMQNIATLEKQPGPAQHTWLIRSMNPCSTGAHNPPYQMPTPLGIFVIQEKKSKMLFTKDGSSEIAGFTPHASRFSGGGYIHGVPVNYPNQTPVEFSSTLGTTPRSHMCIRNATSHAKFIYDWAPVDGALLVVIE